MKKNLLLKLLKIVLVISWLFVPPKTFSQVNKNPQNPPGQTPPPTPAPLIPSEPMKPVSPIPQKPDPTVPPKLTSPAASPSNQPLPPDTVPSPSPKQKSTNDQKPNVTGKDKPVGKDVRGHTLYAEPSGKIYYTDSDGVKIYVK